MRCKTHLYDYSSEVGVCASCLRERLIAVVEAQSRNHWIEDREICRRSDSGDHPPPSMNCQPSVSPYVSRRKSDVQGNDRRFFSTPAAGAERVKKSSGGRFLSFLSGFFRSKSADSGEIPGRNSRDPCTSSPSRFSTIANKRRRNQARTFSVDVTTARHRRRGHRDRGRGISPSSVADGELSDNCSGYSSESSQWMQTPRRTPARATHNKNTSVMFCLSPLVRASPNRQPEPSGGEAKKSKLSAASSFGKNRSRKLADFGRYNNPNF